MKFCQSSAIIERACERTFIKPRFTGSRVSLGDIGEDVPIVRVNHSISFQFPFQRWLDCEKSWRIECSSRDSPCAR